MRTIRTLLKISILDLSFRTGIEKKRLQNIESGKVIPSEKEKILISIELNTPSNKLF